MAYVSFFTTDVMGIIMNEVGRERNERGQREKGCTHCQRSISDCVRNRHNIKVRMGAFT